MGSDRARITYDRNQHYRSVIMQQGRVTLEADWNEAQQISSEELLHQTLEIVGSAGTPDDGYRVVIPPPPIAVPFDFQVDKGVMYVGGVRTWLGEPVWYSNQPDWRDPGPDDPDWVDPAALAANPPANEFIYLLLREQEVSAVEDPDLKDVALGGPDTAQRARLLQRIVRLASQGADCASGLGAAEAHWLTQGLHFDPSTMRLISSGRLSVGAADAQPAPNPCLPQAQGGYVDPDNQLIRVQISGVDPLTQNPMFLWGFDDASFLYLIDVDPNNPQNLLLQSAPVDSFHQPVRGQAVEVLRAAADLSNGGLVAALSGFAFTLDQNYNPDAQSLQLPSGVSLPADYLSGSPAAPLFLRVWQEEKVFTSGVATVLGDTGLEVTLQTADGAPFHLGDYWAFAVRPATPQTVYPERYWNNFQPAEGPRLWACPLAVISWNRQRGVVASDCRNQFENLVELTNRQTVGSGCCTISVTPQDLSQKLTLQSILDAASSLSMNISAVDGGFAGNNITVEIANLRSELSPVTFDVTVTDTVTFFGMTINELESYLGLNPVAGSQTLYSPFPAHVVQSSITTAQGAMPAPNQLVTFSNPQPNAQGNVYDANQNLVFTLEAKKPGDDGNLVTAFITYPATPNGSFNLTLSWTKTLSALTTANCVQNINAGLSYDISAAAPPGRTPVVPVSGIAVLSGGSYDGQVTYTNAATSIFGNPVTICLSPGAYNLPQTLQLTNAHSGMRIEACGGGATFAAITGQESSFQQGLISVAGGSNITLRGLTLKLPAAQLFSAGATFATSVGLVIADSQSVAVKECIFYYPLARNPDQLHAAISGSGDLLGLELRGNQFNGPEDFAGSLASGFEGSFLVWGYLQVPSVAPSESVTGGTVVPTTLDEARFVGNSFVNLAAAVGIAATIGALRLDANTVSTSLTGVTLEHPSPSPTPSAQASTGKAAQTISEVLRGGTLREVISQGVMIGPKSLLARRVATAPANARATSTAPVQKTDAPLVPPVFNVHIANNDIEVILPTTNSFSPVQTQAPNSGSAIDITVQRDTPGWLIVAANRLRNQSSSSATFILGQYGFLLTTITGNLIINDQASATYGVVSSAVSISADGTVAVTGNILRGQVTLPARNPLVPPLAAFPPPMDNWQAYNTEA
jgi:hypothetical protein